MHQRRSLNRASRRMHPAWAAISAATVAVAMVATAAFGGGNILQVQSVAPANIEVYSDTDTFAGGDSIVVDDAAVRTQGGDCLLYTSPSPRD